MVWSDYRFAKGAHSRGLPLAILNLGRTRGDGEATLKLESSCGELLPQALKELGNCAG